MKSVGHSIGDVVCVLNSEEVLVKLSLGSRYVVNVKKCVYDNLSNLSLLGRCEISSTRNTCGIGYNNKNDNAFSSS